MIETEENICRAGIFIFFRKKGLPGDSRGYVMAV